MPGGHYFANGTHRFADILPDHARRAKALDLRLAGPKMAALSAMVDDGRLNLDLPAEPERNHARHSTLLPWNRLLGGARLTGDEQLAEAVIRSSAEKCATGKRFPERPLDVGGAALGSHMLLRWSSPLDLAALNMRGYVAPTGPVLADAPWDEVLVLLARSDDGRSLRLVLQPLDDDETVPVRLTFAGLLLGVPYVLHSDDTPVLAGDEPPSWSASADGDGRATFARGDQRAHRVGPRRAQGAVILNCDRLWSRLMAFSYRVRRRPIVTNMPPERVEPAGKG